MALQSKVWINLAVNSASKSKDFFTALGFVVEPKFSNEIATCVMLGETIGFMLLEKEFFGSFLAGRKQIADSVKTTEAMFALGVDSKEEVDVMVAKALELGGKSANAKQELDFMYGRSFEDLDGHIFEVGRMDQNAMVTHTNM